MLLQQHQQPSLFLKQVADEFSHQGGSWMLNFLFFLDFEKYNVSIYPFYVVGSHTYIDGDGEGATPFSSSLLDKII